MDFLRIVLRNAWRHPLRSILTAMGIAVALFAFAMIRSIIGAWYAGVEATAKNRLVVRNRVSLIFYLPLSYAPRIARVPGVEKVGYGNWFGGTYKDEDFSFASFAIDDVYLSIYPDYVVHAEELRQWGGDRKGMLIGREVSDRFGIKLGDVVQLRGTIFPGLWEFTVRGVFDERQGRKGETRLAYFHWDYLNERNKAELRRSPDNVGFYVVQLAPSANAAVVSGAIDELFANSYAETLTETETAFVQGFVSMSSAIILAMNIISGVVISIMLLVLVNTMMMSLRQRLREYCILKALGFETAALSFLVLGESLLLCTVGFLVLCVLLLPVAVLPAQTIFGQLGDFFPAFEIELSTIALCAAFSLVVAVLAAVMPAASLARLTVTDGLRAV